MDRTLLDDWKLNLTIRNRAPRTIEDYLKVATAYADWCGAKDGLTRRDLTTYFAWLVEQDRSPAYRAKIYRTLQQLFRFLVDEEIVEVNPFAKLKAPVVPEKPVPLLSQDEVRLLLATCDKTFVGLRDTAIMRLLLDTGLRCSELIGIRLDDIDFTHKTITVTGKGRRERMVVFGDKPAEALRRYLRARTKFVERTGRDTDVLWLAQKGPLTDSGLRQALDRRGTKAGVKRVHPHRFRHQFAHDYLAAGGNEGDLQRLAGWRSRAMLSRYGASGAQVRAMDAHRKLGLANRY